MEEFFIIDNREAWRKQRYISMDKLGGNYTWDINKAERFTRRQISDGWAGRTIYGDREKLFVPCDVVERLSFPHPAEGDGYEGHGPVLLRHQAIIEELRKVSLQVGGRQ